jgi:cytoskeletal protein RodZ
MNRLIWIWRMIAIIILLLFTLLMWNLYVRLTQVEQGRAPSPPASSSPEQPRENDAHDSRNQ